MTENNIKDHWARRLYPAIGEILNKPYKPTLTDLNTFARESNKIEGIVDSESNAKMSSLLKVFINSFILTTGDIIQFANELGGKLRDKEGMDVKVGNTYPIKGNPGIQNHLINIASMANKSMSPFKVHGSFEHLHPFTDGNGRTGRAIWLWQMINQENYRFKLGFLHTYYYQSLDD